MRTYKAAAAAILMLAYANAACNGIVILTATPIPGAATQQATQPSPSPDPTIPVEKRADGNTTEIETCTTTADWLNVRECSTTQCRVLGVVAYGTVLTVLGEEGHWMQVWYNQRPAYIYNPYCERN